MKCLTCTVSWTLAIWSQPHLDVQVDKSLYMVIILRIYDYLYHITYLVILYLMQALLQMKMWFVRFPTILQGCESIIEMLRGQYAHSVGCFNEAIFHFIEAAKVCYWFWYICEEYLSHLGKLNGLSQNRNCILCIFSANWEQINAINVPSVCSCILHLYWWSRVFFTGGVLCSTEITIVKRSLSCGFV